jgi:hypothetical protein
MQLGIHTLQISRCDLFLQNHLIEADNEVGVQEPTMEDTQTQAPTNKLEVVQMLGIDARCRIDLEGIVIMSGIFKETVEGIEHFM